MLVVSIVLNVWCSCLFIFLAVLKTAPFQTDKAWELEKQKEKEREEKNENEPCPLGKQTTTCSQKN